MAKLLRNLPPFSRAAEDLAGFRVALAEGVASLENGGWVDFECEVIATVARHAAILGAYCAGQPEFGRERPFFVVGEALGYEPARIRSVATAATAWRKHQFDTHASADAAATCIGLVAEFLDDLQGLIDDYTNLLRRAA
jgi:hypothetical protein